MILHEAECVLFESDDEATSVIEKLISNGFKMWHGGDISNRVDVGYDGGVRWCYGHNFPDCIATLSNQMARSVKTLGMLDDANGNNPHTWISFEDFSKRINIGKRVAVDDLI